MTSTIKPMKAHKYRASKVVSPGLLQTKLNGLRCIWNGKTFNSYNEECWDPSILAHIEAELRAQNLHSLPLDGELYMHGQSLQWINSRAAVTRKSLHKDTPLIQFHIFDVAVSLPFAERWHHLKRIVNTTDTSPLQLCQTFTFNSEYEENLVFNLCRKERYEGMIYRDPEAEYGFLKDCGNQENRWWKIMKRKFWEDVDATICNVYEGRDGFANMVGGFRCLCENGTNFNVGGGEALTHESRRKYWKDPSLVVGKTAKVRYEMLSDSGIPLKPVVEAIY